MEILLATIGVLYLIAHLGLGLVLALITWGILRDSSRRLEWTSAMWFAWPIVIPILGFMLWIRLQKTRVVSTWNDLLDDIEYSRKDAADINW